MADEEQFSGENDLRGSFGSANAKERRVGFFGNAELAEIKLAAQRGFPGLPFGFVESGIIVKFKLDGPFQVGDGGYAFSELTDGVIDRRSISSVQRLRNNKDCSEEEKAEKQMTQARKTCFQQHGGICR
jgi:hypothetical protein